MKFSFHTFGLWKSSLNERIFIVVGMLLLAAIVGWIWTYWPTENMVPMGIRESGQQGHKASLWNDSQNTSLTDNTPSQNTLCHITRKQERVEGTSMAGILESGQIITTLEWYYRCNSVAKGDIVTYNYAGLPIPVVKKVLGVPGDVLAIRQSASGSWNIFINNEKLKTTLWYEYTLLSNQKRLLALYEWTIPKDTYMILGNQPGGTTDSTVFWLVNVSELNGKVAMP